MPGRSPATPFGHEVQRPVCSHFFGLAMDFLADLAGLSGAAVASSTVIAEFDLVRPRQHQQVHDRAIYYDWAGFDARSFHGSSLYTYEHIPFPVCFGIEKVCRQTLARR